jgi:hypothetical protein
MFRCVLILSPIAVYSLLVAGCATDQAPPSAPINDPPRTEKQVLSPPAKEARGAIPQAPVREPPRVDRFEPPTPRPSAAPATVPRRVERPAPPALTDAKIVSRLIAASLASYPGNCPCPDNVDRAGRCCGGRSAYSRPGGYAPLCYPHDVTPAMIQLYRQRGH